MLNSLNWLFSNENKVDKQSNEVVQLQVNDIVPNQFQPRTVFSEEKINELAQTIKNHGIIQPIVVRKMDNRRYEVIAGERRLRATKALNWNKIPVIIRNLTDTESASVALIENIQREGLTAIEEASAYVQLIELHELTQEALAQRLGKSQSTIANRIRLLKLTKEVQVALLNKQITERHGRILLKLEEDLQEKYLKKVLDDNLNVKELENLINALLNKEKTVKKRKKLQIISKDARIAKNTIKQSLKMIASTGIEVESEEKESEEFYQVTIRIRK